MQEFSGITAWIHSMQEKQEMVGSGKKALTSSGRGCWFLCGLYHGTEQQLPLQRLQGLCSSASVCLSGGWKCACHLLVCLTGKGMGLWLGQPPLRQPRRTGTKIGITYSMFRSKWGSNWKQKVSDSSRRLSCVYAWCPSARLVACCYSSIMPLGRLHPDSYLHAFSAGP